MQETEVCATALFLLARTTTNTKTRQRCTKKPSAQAASLESFTYWIVLVIVSVLFFTQSWIGHSLYQICSHCSRNLQALRCFEINYPIFLQMLFLYQNCIVEESILFILSLIYAIWLILMCFVIFSPFLCHMFSKISLYLLIEFSVISFNTCSFQTLWQIKYYCGMGLCNTREKGGKYLKKI